MSKEKYKLPEHYFAYNDGTPSYEIEDCIIQECESAGLNIEEDEDLAKQRGYDQAFIVTNPYKDKIKKILEICKINAKGWDPIQHDGAEEFKSICDLIEEKGWYKK